MSPTGGFDPCGFGQMVQLCGRVGPGGQDLGHVTAAESGDLRCRLLVGGRPCQSSAHPVLGDCRQMRHDVTDRPAGTGRNGGAPRRVVESRHQRDDPFPRFLIETGNRGGSATDRGSLFGPARRSWVVGVVGVGVAEPPRGLVFAVFVVPAPPFVGLGLRVALR